MGWTGNSTWVGAKAKDIIQDEMPFWTILRTETVGTRTYFAACRSENPERIVGFVALITRKKGEVCIKIISEDEGPYYYEASDKLIGMLSPLPDPDDKNLWAARWRACCLKNAAKPKFKEGVLAMTLEPLDFGKGQYKFQFFGKLDKYTYACDAAGGHPIRVRFDLVKSGYEWKVVRMNEVQKAAMRDAIDCLGAETLAECDAIVGQLKDRSDMFYADLNYHITKNMKAEEPTLDRIHTYITQMLRNYGVRFFTSD